MKTKLIATIMMVALLSVALVTTVGRSHALTPQYDLTGTWTFMTSFDSINWIVHTMTISSFDPITGAFSGTGYTFYEGQFRQWTITGTEVTTSSETTVTFTLVTGGVPVTYFGTGTVNSATSMSGTGTGPSGVNFWWKIIKYGGGISWWHFNEGIGTTTKDEAGTNDFGTLNNFDGTATSGWTTSGKFGNALCFDGVDDYVSVAHQWELDIIGEITIEAWINPDTVGHNTAIVSKGCYTIGVGWVSNYGLGMMSDGKIGFYISNVGANLESVVSTNPVLAGRWTHVAATFNPASDVVKIYINGDLDNTGAIKDEPVANDYPLYIGALIDTGNGDLLRPVAGFDGIIDEVRIWNVVLSDEEVAASAGLGSLEVPIKDGINAIILSNGAVDNVFVSEDVLKFTVSGLSGTNGWIDIAFPKVNNTAITVYVDSTPITPTITAYETYYLIRAELTFSTHTVEIRFTDLQPPTITISTPSDGATYILNQVVIADWTATDTQSGVNWAATSGTVLSGTSIDTGSIGEKTFSVTATDMATPYDCNSITKTVTYYVHYNFGGFLSPLGKATYKAGSTIPVKFKLTDALGNYVSTASLTSITVDGIAASPTSSSGFRYDATSQQYIFNLNTKDLATGSHTIVVTLDDGAKYSISIYLK